MTDKVTNFKNFKMQNVNTFVAQLLTMRCPTANSFRDEMEMMEVEHLLKALMWYLIEHRPEGDCTMEILLMMLSAMITDEESYTIVIGRTSATDLIFQKLIEDVKAKKEDDKYSLGYWKTYKIGEKGHQARAVGRAIRIVTDYIYS